MYHLSQGSGKILWTSQIEHRNVLTFIRILLNLTADPIYLATSTLRPSLGSVIFRRQKQPWYDFVFPKPRLVSPRGPACLVGFSPIIESFLAILNFNAHPKEHRSSFLSECHEVYESISLRLTGSCISINGLKAYPQAQGFGQSVHVVIFSNFHSFGSKLRLLALLICLTAYTTWRTLTRASSPSYQH